MCVCVCVYDRFETVVRQSFDNQFKFMRQIGANTLCVCEHYLVRNGADHHVATPYGALDASALWVCFIRRLCCVPDYGIFVIFSDYHLPKI